MSIHSRNFPAGLGWAAVAILVWSGAQVMLRLGVTTGPNAYDLTMLRFAVAGLLLAPIALRRGRGTDRLGVMGLGAMVVCFGAPYVLLVALAMKTAPAAAAGALNPGAMAIVSVLLGRAILGDRIGGARLIGLALTTLGIVLITRAGGAVTTGHLILIATGIMWAGYTLIVRRAAVPALNATAIVAVGSAVVYLPVYLLALPKQIGVAPLTDILVQAGFQGVLVSIAAFYAFNRSAELLGPVAGATLPALVPVATLGLGVVALGETAGTDALFAAVPVTVGLVLILVGKPAAHWISSRIPAGVIGSRPS